MPLLRQGRAEGVKAGAGEAVPLDEAPERCGYCGEFVLGEVDCRHDVSAILRRGASCQGSIDEHGFRVRPGGSVASAPHARSSCYWPWLRLAPLRLARLRSVSSSTKRRMTSGIQPRVGFTSAAFEKPRKLSPPMSWLDARSSAALREAFLSKPSAAAGCCGTS